MVLATTIVGGAAAALAGASYLNAKYHLRKDLGNMRVGIVAKSESAAILKRGEVNAWFKFSESVKKYPTSDAIWYRGKSLTMTEVHTLACQYAAYLSQLGVGRYQTVALYMKNSPEYMITWLACWAIGATPAMINYGLVGDALAHVLKLSKASVVFSDVDIAENIHALNSGYNVQAMTAELKAAISAMDAPVPDPKVIKYQDPDSAAMLLYTSGTSGFPKACPFKRGFFSFAMCGRLNSGLCTKPGPGGDRWYICMPLYHGSGGITGMSALCGGITICLAEKFSVKNFWTDIRDSRATVFIYVGETARYLLANPPSPLDKTHNVKMMWGNGMRPDVWSKFQERFAIPMIHEFFGATEGVFGLMNPSTGPFSKNAVGHEGGLIRFLMRNKYFTAALDPETGDIQRDSTGLVVESPLTVGGELMHALDDEKGFGGYHGDPAATEKRLVRNVRRKGDLYYRTGDSLRRDENGLWFFMDRLGETFRWKSENVSTTEVAAVVGSVPGVQEAVVYGVPVPGNDGKAGCARIYLARDTANTFDWSVLLSTLRDKLPKYAVPIFLRISDNPAPTTGNNKIIKGAMTKQGIDVASIMAEGDRMMWAKPGADTYVDFTPQDYAELQRAQPKL